MGYTLSDGNFNPMGWSGGYMNHNHQISGVNVQAQLTQGLTSAAGNFWIRRVTPLNTWNGNVENVTVLSFGGSTKTGTNTAIAVDGITELTALLPPYQVVNFVIKT
jgi:hypothetical protein